MRFHLHTGPGRSHSRYHAEFEAIRNAEIRQRHVKRPKNFMFRVGAIVQMAASAIGILALLALIVYALVSKYS